jgi:hypothetical protein
MVMMRAWRLSLLAVGGVGLLTTAAAAQTEGADPAASKWERAKIQIETVCRAHEADKRFDLAAKFYDEVTAMLTAAPPAADPAPAVAVSSPAPTSRPAQIVTAKQSKPVAAEKRSVQPKSRIARKPAARSVRVATRPARRPVALAAVPAAPLGTAVAQPANRRCASLLCRQFVLLGVAY